MFLRVFFFSRPLSRRSCHALIQETQPRLARRARRRAQRPRRLRRRRASWARRWGRGGAACSSRGPRAATASKPASTPRRTRPRAPRQGLPRRTCDPRALALGARRGARRSGTRASTELCPTRRSTPTPARAASSACLTLNPRTPPRSTTPRCRQRRHRHDALVRRAAAPRPRRTRPVPKKQSARARR